mmetsp:Transcript_394/g.724  ORF Transcript_394/g.724 Transcript_394/m.724 type:complete len:82 (+) Transcript_394:25-270(+)
MFEDRWQYLLLTIFFLFVFPPLGVYLVKPFGFSKADYEALGTEYTNKYKLVIICSILTLFGYFPGIVFAIHIFLKYQAFVE